MQTFSSDVPATKSTTTFCVKTGKRPTIYRRLENIRKVHFRLLATYLQSYFDSYAAWGRKS